MRRKRRNHKPEFKAKVALTAIQGDLTMAEWKKQLLNGASNVFGGNVSKSEESEEAILELHAKIGQLTMENDFLEHGLERIHGARGKKW